jgi:UDP-hydrolysing UDP-N-acetyl-D-glucosamine 2-epimerase
MRKICAVVTARPSYSRIKTALAAIRDHKDLELQLVIAGAALLDRYGNAVEFIKRDGFTIDEKVFMVLEGENKTAMAKTTGLGVMELSNVFYNLQPDAVITIADRYETIATSIAAAYQNIPLVHIQGGEVTGNIDEKVRHANTKLADIHLVASEDAYNRVIKLGEEPAQVYNVGCPSIDLAHEVMQSPELDYHPIEKYGGVGCDFDVKEPYIVVMQHPVTTEYESAKSDILKTLEAVTELDINTYWFWPNVDAGSDGTSNGIRSFREKHKNNKLRFFKNMEPKDFLRLLVNSHCLIGNSSVGIRECAYMGVPVVNIGSRQNRRERGNNVKDVAYDKEAIKSAIQQQMQNKEIGKSLVYGNGEAGKKIAELLAKIDLPFHKTITY